MVLFLQARVREYMAGLVKTNQISNWTCVLGCKPGFLALETNQSAEFKY